MIVARPRRRQLRGPAPVQRRAARARRRRLPGAGRVRGRPRAGHAALRPRRRRPRIHADRRGAGSSCPTSPSCSSGSSARAPALARGHAPPPRRATRQRLERAHERLGRAAALLLERRRAALERRAGRLRALSPRATLDRGYAIVRAGERDRPLAPQRVQPGDARRRRARRGRLRRAGRGVRASRPSRRPSASSSRSSQRLESGEAPLDEAIALWERGEELYRVLPGRELDARAKGNDRGARPQRGDAERRKRCLRIRRMAEAPVELLQRVPLFAGPRRAASSSGSRARSRSARSSRAAPSRARARPARASS